MLDRIKQGVADTKAFVKKHQTLVACGATAVVTATVVHRSDLRAAKEFVYNMGYEHGNELGTAYIHLSLFHDFVESSDLKDEFMAHARGVIADSADLA